MECILAAGLLAGGTGVTAMVNLATVILKNPADKVKVRAQHLSNGHIASVCWRRTACEPCSDQQSTRSHNRMGLHAHRLQSHPFACRSSVICF